jgi:hypothetical protein
MRHKARLARQHNTTLVMSTERNKKSLTSEKYDYNKPITSSMTSLTSEVYENMQPINNKFICIYYW